jgi:RNA polymerase sigma factor (TIGR02999 family)
MSDVTNVLSAIESGDTQAAARLLPMVYDELRRLAEAKLAGEKPGNTLQATALVHEAYLRLVGPGDTPRWDSRGHFFASAAEAMRRILIDRARDRKRLKRGGGQVRRDLDLAAIVGEETPPEDLIDLDAALDRLEGIDAQAATLVKLRLFAGLTVQEAASALGVSLRTAERDWTFARTWLYGQLAPRDDAG